MLDNVTFDLANVESVCSEYLLAVFTYLFIHWLLTSCSVAGFTDTSETGEKLLLSGTIILPFPTAAWLPLPITARIPLPSV